MNGNLINLTSDLTVTCESGSGGTWIPAGEIMSVTNISSCSTWLARNLDPADYTIHNPERRDGLPGRKSVMYVSLRGAILALIGGVSQRGDSDLNDARQYIAEVISDVATLGYFVGDDADPASLRAKASELYRAADYLTSLRSTAV